MFGKLRPNLGDVGGIDEMVSKDDEVLYSQAGEKVRTRRV